MATFHILTQYVWPDGAPTGLYAEHLATRLQEHGCDVLLVGGQGNYRSLGRPKPEVELRHLEHYQGRRGNLVDTFSEYISINRMFANYINRVVRQNDVVIVTSAPPNTVQLATTIKQRGARAIYWLQDYYPELIRGICDYPAPLRSALRNWWDKRLAQWDKVVKIAANLGGPNENAIVIRNWPTISFDEITEPERGTALYLGNLGYGHDIDLLAAECERLRDAGYKVNIRADGRGVRRLPGWLNARPPCASVKESHDELLGHEVHIIAAHPKIQQAIFPSKIWNSLAAKRELVCPGFAEAMADELAASRNAPFDQHLDQWIELLLPMTEASRKWFAVAA